MARKDSINRNAEGYPDHTAGMACERVYREQILRHREEMVLHRDIMKNLVGYVRRFMELMGYELVGITYRDLLTGQEWKKK